jgi:hypothetical protein
MPTNFTAQLLGAILPWILLGGLISILAAVFRVLLLPKLKSRLGEASVNFRAKRDLDPAV